VWLGMVVHSYNARKQRYEDQSEAGLEKLTEKQIEQKQKKQKKQKKPDSMAQAVEHLPSKHKVLN
jgi:hypothetical protein